MSAWHRIARLILNWCVCSGSLQVNGCLFSLAALKQVQWDSMRFLGFVLGVFWSHYTVICFNGTNFYLNDSIIIVRYYVLITNTHFKREGSKLVFSQSYDCVICRDLEGSHHIKQLFWVQALFSWGQCGESSLHIPFKIQIIVDCYSWLNPLKSASLVYAPYLNHFLFLHILHIFRLLSNNPDFSVTAAVRLLPAADRFNPVDALHQFYQKPKMSEQMKKKKTQKLN